MNVQPVSIMPTSVVTGVQKRDVKSLTSTPEKENRVEIESFSKELERKVDQSTMDREPVPPGPNLVATKKTVPPQGQKSANDESKVTDDSSVEKRDAIDSEKKTSESDFGQSKLIKKETKEDRLKKFMDSLESEFQIPPTRIVEAFSELSPQELSLPADQSADRIVDKLNLDEKSAEKVKTLYGDLVQDLGKIDARAADSLTAQKAVGLTSLGFAQQRFDKVKTQRTALQKSLDQMNQNFWQPQVMAQTANQTSIQTPNLAKSELIAKSVRERNGLESYRDLSQAGLDSLKSDALDLQLDRDFIYDPRTGEVFSLDPELKAAQFDATESLAKTGVEGPIVEDGDQPAAEKLTALAGSAILAKSYGTERAPQVEAMPKPNVGPGKATSLNVSPTDLASAPLSKLNVLSGSSKGGSDFFSKGDRSPESKRSDAATTKKTDGEEMKNLLAATMVAGAETKDNSLNGPIVPAPASGQEINQGIADKNMQTVFHQAQYLVKNGGGEMKVKMTPEGLGEIQLNVQLKDGRVQLQMVAENKDTKKMLESNLSSLRDSLSQQKITLDSVKIDTVVKTNVENQTQNNSHFNQNQNRDAQDTRQFWNQFQDQFGGRPQREALFEPPKVTGYAPKKSDPLGPATESSASARPNGKSKSLNLVA